MLYCTYDQYQTAGGTLDEAAFTPLCFRASKLIDRATFGRAEAHTKGCADCSEALAMACASIVQSLERAEAARAATGYAPGVTSVNNDGFAVTFSDGALAEKQVAEAYSILSCCIGGVSDAVQRYRCEPHPRHRHRDRPACLPRHPRVQLAGEAGHLRRRPPADSPCPAAPCRRVSALFPVGKAPARGKGDTLDAQAGRQAHLRRCPQPDRGRVCRPRENTHLLHGGGGLRQPGTAAAALARGRELRT